jgi:ribonucleoside-diphosphate reductase alpha chain
MAVLRVDHPDVEQFITCKTNENQITNFNISVGITDAFMQAVENDEMWELRFPDVHAPEYHDFNGSFEEAEGRGIPFKVYKRVRARELFQKIVHQAHLNGEPGVLFLDAANRSNPVPHLYQLEATNPCGEQWLGPYENCCLGSVNLAEHCAPNGQVNWQELQHSVELATLFLDDVVDANQYVPAVPQLKQAAHRARRIGLGIMGLADLMYHVGVRYGSPEGQEFASQVMEFVRYHAMRTSIELARQRGSFPAITGSIYDPANLRWSIPEPIVPHKHDWGRPAIDWEEIRKGILANGIRNAAQTTVAPTGTIATVAGCEGYGCEPVFALAYIRHVNDNGKDLQLTYASPLFEKALQASGLSAEERQKIFDQVMAAGSCQGVADLPEAIRNVFVVSQDISAEEHVYTQAAMQAFVDNSLSKTINFPPGASEEEVALAYQLAWNLGCKGLTVYVTGSREKVVLETHATATKKESEPAATEKTAQQLSAWNEGKKARPRFLTGFTYSVETPLGKAFVTVNENGGNQPFEVFINTAKAGSDTAAVSEAIGRLLSYVLRLTSAIEPSQRLREAIRQLSGIGGGRSLGFGPKRVRSLPDGVAQVLEEYLRQREERMAEKAARAASAPTTTLPESGNGHQHEGVTITIASPSPVSEQAAGLPIQATAQPRLLQIGDLCPECGQAAVINEEGCRKCYSCGYSEC